MDILFFLDVLYESNADYQFYSIIGDVLKKEEEKYRDI